MAGELDHMLTIELACWYFPRVFLWVAFVLLHQIPNICGRFCFSKMAAKTRLQCDFAIVPSRISICFSIFFSPED